MDNIEIFKVYSGNHFDIFRGKATRKYKQHKNELKDKILKGMIRWKSKVPYTANIYTRSINENIAYTTNFDCC